MIIRILRKNYRYYGIRRFYGGRVEIGPLGYLLLFFTGRTVEKEKIENN